MMFIKIFCYIVSFTMLFIASFAILEEINLLLKNKSKDNKFRKWWSNNVCDLDDLYN